MERQAKAVVAWSKLLLRVRGERRERESNPLVEVLQTPAFPLGYPAVIEGAQN